MDGCQSGRLGTPGKRVYRKVPRVRIPPHPPCVSKIKAPKDRRVDRRKLLYLGREKRNMLRDHEMATMFVVLSSFSRGWSALFGLVCQPGGCRGRRGRIDRTTRAQERLLKPTKQRLSRRQTKRDFRLPFRRRRKGGHFWLRIQNRLHQSAGNFGIPSRSR